MKIQAAGRVWDSKTEYFFYAWLEEASRWGMIEILGIQPSWQVFDGLDWLRPCHKGTKVKETRRILLQPKKYTADFRFRIGKKFPLHPTLDLGWTPEDADYGARVFSVDVKPPKRGSRQDWTRRFANDQKAMWEKHKIFVERVEPWAIFEKTYVPEAVFLDAIRNKNVGSKVKNPQNIQQFMNGVLTKEGQNKNQGSKANNLKRIQ